MKYLLVSYSLFLLKTFIFDPLSLNYSEQYLALFLCCAPPQASGRARDQRSSDQGHSPWSKERYKGELKANQQN